jgi:uroporphyrinogen III methyltransferase/synthase
MSSSKGVVYLVGAGPGDPELITLKAMRLLREADVVLYDRLLPQEILSGLRAELIDVGKSASHHKLSQEEINRLLIKKALEGKVVVRLKGGDPYVFGRGGEEALALRAEGITFFVVPGITSAVAVPELAGIPVTHRGVSTSLTIVTGHEEPGKDNLLDWSALANLGGTLVVLMGVSRLAENVSALIAGGRDPSTPAAIIERGGFVDQRQILGTLQDIVSKAEGAAIKPPAILVVGEVVSLSPLLRRRRLALFRAAGQMQESIEMALALGFDPVPSPSISLQAVPLPEDIEERIGLADYVVFTSSNGVHMALSDPILKSAIAKRRVAAIGPMTAKALSSSGIEVSLIPEEYSSKGLAKALLGSKRVILLRSAQGSPVLVGDLSHSGVVVDDVPVYNVVGSGDHRLDELISGSLQIDAFAFSSASTVRYLIKRSSELGLEQTLRSAMAGAKVAAIGPPTAEELGRQGIRVDVMPQQYTFYSMLEELARDGISSQGAGRTEGE